MLGGNILPGAISDIALSVTEVRTERLNFGNDATLRCSRNDTVGVLSIYPSNRHFIIHDFCAVSCCVEGGYGNGAMLFNAPE